MNSPAERMNQNVAKFPPMSPRKAGEELMEALCPGWKRKENDKNLWFLDAFWPEEGPLNETEVGYLSLDSSIFLVADNRDFLMQFLRDGADVCKLNEDDTPVPEGVRGAFSTSGEVVVLNDGRGSHIWFKKGHQGILGGFCECMFPEQITEGGA